MNKKIIVALVALVGVVSIAYAAFTQSLTISGTGTTSGDWDVAITNISQTSATGATDTTAPSYTATSATFDVELAYPGATATYDVTIDNNGSIPAIVTSIDGVSTANAAAPSYITYALTGVAVNDQLAAGGTQTAQLKVEWDPASSPTTTSESKTATVTINYGQDT